MVHQILVPPAKLSLSSGPLPVLLTLWGMELFPQRGGFHEKGTVIVPDLGVEIVRLTSSVPRPVRFGPFRHRYNDFSSSPLLYIFIKKNCLAPRGN
jgi:hypothetical protein